MLCLPLSGAPDLCLIFPASLFETAAMRSFRSFKITDVLAREILRAIPPLRHPDGNLRIAVKPVRAVLNTSRGAIGAGHRAMKAVGNWGQNRVAGRHENLQ